MSAARPLRVAFCTALTANFVSHGRVLARSIRAHHPGASIHAAVSERATTLGDWRETDFHIVPMETFGLPDLPRQAFIGTPHELTVLAKPLILRHVLRSGYDAALFLDGDIFVTGDLSPLVDQVAAHAVTLSPHLLAPLASADRVERELTIIRSGTFNGGFVGVSARPEAFRFLDWWLARLATHNRMEPWAGLHHDQRWLDLAPSFFEEVAIVRDPGCNVAYWNLPERGLRWEAGALTTNGGPCRFFHFSGFDAARPERLSRHSSRLMRTDLGSAAVVCDRYAEQLREAGVEEIGARPYSYGAFDNGVAIPLVARGLFRGLGGEAARFGDPFQTGHAGCFFDWLREPDMSASAGRGLPRLWQAVYGSRHDLQQAFPDPGERDRERFINWVAGSGLAEHDIDARFSPAAGLAEAWPGRSS